MDDDKMLEAMYVNNTLDAIVASNGLLDRFSRLLKAKRMNSTEQEIIELCKEFQVPYQFFYDEATYRSEKLPNIGKFLIVDGKCIGAKMSN